MRLERSVPQGSILPINRCPEFFAAGTIHDRSGVKRHFSHLTILDLRRALLFLDPLFPGCMKTGMWQIMGVHSTTQSQNPGFHKTVEPGIAQPFSLFVALF